MREEERGKCKTIFLVEFEESSKTGKEQRE